MIERLRAILQVIMISVALVLGATATTTVVPVAIDTVQVAQAATPKPWYFPVEGGTISSGYGPRNGENHWGIDVAATLGNGVIAPADLTIIWAGPMDGYGTIIQARFDNRPEWVIWVGHCTVESVNGLSAGMQFAGGTRFASVGNVGQSTGPHTHFELYINNARVSPAPIFEDEYGPDIIPDPPAANPAIPSQMVDPLTDLINRGRELIGVK